MRTVRPWCWSSSPAAVGTVRSSFPFDLQAVVLIVAGGRLRNVPGSRGWSPGPGRRGDGRRGDRPELVPVRPAGRGADRRRGRTVRPWCWSSSPAAAGTVRSSFPFDLQAVVLIGAGGVRCARCARGAGHRARPPWCWSPLPGRRRRLAPVRPAGRGADRRRGRTVRPVRPWCWSSSPAAVVLVTTSRPWCRSSPGAGCGTCQAPGAGHPVPAAVAGLLPFDLQALAGIRARCARGADRRRGVVFSGRLSGVDRTSPGCEQRRNFSWGSTGRHRRGLRVLPRAFACRVPVPRCGIHARAKHELALLLPGRRGSFFGFVRKVPTGAIPHSNTLACRGRIAGAIPGALPRQPAAVPET